MKDILQRLKELKTERLVSRIKHLRGRHDQRDHNRWPAGYQAQGYIPVGGGRRAGLLSSRATGGLAGLTQTNILMNQTKRLEPKVKIGTPDPLLAPMPIDVSEFLPGGKIYEAVTDVSSSETARDLHSQVVMSYVKNDRLWALRSEYYNQFASHSLIGGLKVAFDFISHRNALTIRDLMRNNPTEWVLARRSNGLVNSNPYTPNTNAANQYEEKIQYQLELAQNNYKQMQEYENRISKMRGKYYKFESVQLPNYNDLIIEFAKYSDPDVDMEYGLPSNPDKDYNYLNVTGIVKQLNYDLSVLYDLKLELEESEYNESFDSYELKKQIDFQEKQIKDRKENIRDIINAYIRDDKDLANKFFNDFTNYQNMAMEHLALRNRALQLQTNILRESIKDVDIQSLSDVANLLQQSVKMRKDDNNIFSQIFLGNKSTPIALDIFIRTNGIDETKKQFESFKNELNSIKDYLTEINKSLEDNSNISSYMKTSLENISNLLNHFKSVDINNLRDYENPELDEFLENESENIKKEMIRSFFTSDVPSVVQKSLGLIYEMQSYNGKPEVVGWDEIIDPTTDVVKDEKGNPLLFWRTLKGVNWDDPTGQDRGEEYVEEMRSGEVHYPGTGVSGYGSYVKTSNYMGNNKDTRGNLPNANDSVGITPEITAQIKRHIDTLKPLFDNVNQDYLESVFDYFLYNIDANDPTGLQQSLDMVNDQIELAIRRSTSMQNTVALKKAFNDINTAVMATKKGKQYTRNEALAADAIATRQFYGEYTNGYTINSDARIPVTFVNKRNNGNDSHFNINSLDDEVIDFLEKTYGSIMDGISGMNTGVAMAILGWDAYPVHVNEYSTNYVILNRAILNMSNRTMGPDYTEDDIRQSIENRKLVK